MSKRIGKFLVSGCLLSLMIASFIIPDRVYAAGTGDPVLSVLWSFETGSGETYVHCDLIYTNSNPSSYGYFTFSYNRENIVNSCAMMDGTGVTSITYENYTDGSNAYRRYTIDYDNTGYFVIRHTFRATTTYWNQSALHNPKQKVGLDFSNYTLGYYVEMENNNTVYLWQISNYLRNGLNIDTSNLEDLLDTIVTNQETIIANQQGNQQSSSTVSGNDQINSGLSDVAGDYEDFEQDVISDFNDNLDDLSTSDLTDNLTQLTAPVNWLKTQMDLLFNSMGSFKFIPEIVLMLAIALIFIGR